MAAFNSASLGTKGRSNSGQFPPTVASAVLERHNLARRATPDSDALVSSDDDHEVPQMMSQSAHVGSQSSGLARPGRRASWLSEVSSSQARKKSTSGASKPNSIGVPSQPSTPQTENAPSATNTYFANPFSNTSRTMNRPSALSSSIAAPSPTTATFDDMRSPTTQFNPPPSAGLGVPIPTEPVRKAVRSQSYSAGQLEELNIENLSLYGTDRFRAGPAHRASRPSLLDRTLLQSLQEDDDAESSMPPSYAAQPAPTSKVRPTEFGGYSGLRRSSTTPITQNIGPTSESYEEEEDTFQQEYAQKPLPNKLLSSAFARPIYSSSLGFDTSEDMPQSRRHSFAALSLPRTRNGSMPVQRNDMPSHLMKLDSYGQPSLSQNQMSLRDPSGQEREYANSLAAQQRLQTDERDYGQREQSSDQMFAASYFSGVAAQARHIHEQAAEEDVSGNYSVPNVYSRPGRILHVVSFKCARADIYYIDDNMGLELTPGDTVIVDGDRGTDLGTVEHCNLSMPEAKRLKHEYTKKHFKNLMMFSRLFPHMAALAGNDELVDKSFSLDAGSPSSGVTMPGPLEQEPRPKAIRRIATPDELHLLREKEGNEAKAKRLCQNKVSEHGLRMEVLDAEFQHDYKKLTFFYYAEEYINFNQLVTELFKVYKTRIWMSAINAASHSLMNQNHPMRSGPTRGPPHAGHAGHTGHAGHAGHTGHAGHAGHASHIPPPVPGRPAGNYNGAPYGHPSQSPFAASPAGARWASPAQQYSQMSFGYAPVGPAASFNGGGAFAAGADYGSPRGR